MLMRGNMDIIPDAIRFSYFIYVFIVMNIIMLSYIKNIEKVEIIKTLLYYVSIIVCFVGFVEIILQKQWTLILIEYFGINSDKVNIIPSIENYIRPISLIGNPIPLGMFCSCIGVLSLHHCIQYNSYKHTFVFIINALMVFLSFSRSSWLGFIISISVLLLMYVIAFYKKKILSKIWIITFVSTIVMLSITICMYLFIEESKIDRFNIRTAFFGRLENVKEDPNVLYRLIQWNRAITEVTTFSDAILFGYGPGSNWYYYGKGLSMEERKDPEIVTESPTFDNTFISILYQYGFFGILWVISLMIMYFIYLLKRYEFSEHWRIAVITGIVVNSLFFEIFPWNIGIYIFMFAATIPRNIRYKKSIF